MRILHPTDFSEGADRARAVAAALARALSAELVLLHVLGPMTPQADELDVGPLLERIRAGRRDFAEGELTRRVVEAHERGLRARGRLEVGEPWVEILRVAGEEGADAVVLGTAGLGGVGRLLVGSVADRVIRRADCPVVSVREDARTRLTA